MLFSGMESGENESKCRYNYIGGSKTHLLLLVHSPTQPGVKAFPPSSSIAISETPSPSHIYFHGNPGKAFCSLKTTFALSSCKLALSKAECIPTALNELKKAEFGWPVVIWEGP